jgi:SAM-dependent methyltransferase
MEGSYRGVSFMNQFARKGLRFVIRKCNYRGREIKKSAEYWGENRTAEADNYWWNVLAIRSAIQKRITGDAGLSWYTQQVMERCTPFGRVLAFGDGYGMAAEAWVRKRDVSEIVYINISEGEGERAREIIKKAGVPASYHFVKTDANQFDFSTLEPDFDTIISVGAFHHFKNFESIFPQLNLLLKPDGILYADEYIGPTRWAFDRLTTEMINRLLSVLPPELIVCRKEVTAENFVRLLKHSQDQSEAVRSSDLDQALRYNFETIESTSFGGSLFLPLFLTAQFSPCRLNIFNWHHATISRSWAERLVSMEECMENTGLIRPCYLYYKLRKKSESRPGIMT